MLVRGLAAVAVLALAIVAVLDVGGTLVDVVAFAAIVAALVSLSRLTVAFAERDGPPGPRRLR